MEDKRKRYKCECKCGGVFYACKSLFQEMGELDKGHGTCPKCETFLNLTFDEKNEKMVLTEWNEWIEKRKRG